MRSRIIILAAVACGTELACLGNLHAGHFSPSRFGFAFTTLGSLAAAPGTIDFHATNPDGGSVSGSSPGGLTWTVSGGSHLRNWTALVQAGSSSPDSCPTVPASAIQVSCSSANVSGGSGTGACNGTFALSTTAQQIASGAEGDGTNSYSISVNFTLAESWHYVADSSCPLTITYTVNAP